MTGKRPEILIVDDDPINIEILSEILSDLCEVIFATTAERGLSLAYSEAPDLILLDVMMPGIDGYEMCRVLKSDSRTDSIPVIFVSAMESETDQEAGLALGAIDFITKPINAAAVRARVKAHLDSGASLERVPQASSFGDPDGLVGLEMLARQLDTEWNRLRRAGESLALLIVTMDRGSTIGEEEAQRRLGDLLRSSLRRPSDLIASRIGGGFTCLLPGIGEQGAENLVKMITEAAENAGLSVSIGIAVMGPATRDEAPEALLAKAEADLLERSR